MADEEKRHPRVEFPRSISLGNWIQILLILLMAMGAYSTFNSDLTAKQKDIEANARFNAQLEKRVSILEGERFDLRDRMVKVEIELRNTTAALKELTDAVKVRPAP
ncbi:MAG: hypothetical protein AB7L41_06660 [Flavobacteriaceae bacterium]